jgi:hypothetical protein
MNSVKKLPRIKSVQHVGDYRLSLTFSDGVHGEIDLSDWIRGKGGVFTPLEDPSFFAQVRVSASGGTIEWPNQVDFCPDTLYHAITGSPLPGETKEGVSA